MGLESIPNPEEEEVKKPEPGAVVERPQESVEKRFKEEVNGNEIRINPTPEGYYELYLPTSISEKKRYLNIGSTLEEAEAAFVAAKKSGESALIPDHIYEDMVKYLAAKESR